MFNKEWKVLRLAQWCANRHRHRCVLLAEVFPSRWTILTKEKMNAWDIPEVACLRPFSFWKPSPSVEALAWIVFLLSNTPGAVHLSLNVSFSSHPGTDHVSMTFAFRLPTLSLLFWFQMKKSNETTLNFALWLTSQLTTLEDQVFSRHKHTALISSLLKCSRKCWIQTAAVTSSCSSGNERLMSLRQTLRVVLNRFAQQPPDSLEAAGVLRGIWLDVRSSILEVDQQTSGASAERTGVDKMNWWLIDIDCRCCEQRNSQSSVVSEG